MEEDGGMESKSERASERGRGRGREGERDRDREKESQTQTQTVTETSRTVRQEGRQEVPLFMTR